MKRIAALAMVLAVLCLALPQPGQADPGLADLAGSWAGSGSVRPDLFDAKQTARCRLKGKPQANGVMILAGRCAIPSKAFHFRLKLWESENGQRIHATSGSATAAPLALSGTANAGGFRLTSDTPVRHKRRQVDLQIDIDMSGPDQLEITQHVTDLDTGAQSTSSAFSLHRN